MMANVRRRRISSVMLTKAGQGSREIRADKPGCERVNQDAKRENEFSTTDGHG
jgi:hypothetical protein